MWKVNNSNVGIIFRDIELKQRNPAKEIENGLPGGGGG